jgi:type IV fimbrial biogenesis protein FimT
MSTMSRAFRERSTAGTRGRGAGFTLIEMMFTLSLAAIAMAITVPSLGRMNADIRTRSTAEQLAGALRLAQINAMTRNRPVALMLTNSTPGASAAPATNGSNWLVALLPPSASRDPAAGPELIQVASVAVQNRVTLTGPARVCFDQQGMQSAIPGPADGTSSACAQPGGDVGGATSYLVSRTGSTRRFKVRVYRTGRVDICDPAQPRSKDSDGCL